MEKEKHEEIIKKDEGEKNTNSEKDGTKKINQKKVIFIAISAVVLILLGLLIFKLSPEDKKLNLENAKNKAEIFINENLMLPGTKASITEITKEYGLYKILVDVGSGELIESYISQDGKLFLPQAINIEEYNYPSNDELEPSEVTNKQETLDIELFIMSHCPYGTQMEKGLIPVLETLKNYVDFELKFNTYVMHDKVELDEQLTQYCIQKEEGEKLLSYLKCFNVIEDSNTCLAQSQIDKNKISACVKTTDDQYKITENYNDITTWLGGTYPLFPLFEEDNNKYNIQGSPTLVINGEIVSSNLRDSQSLLELVCTGFISAPGECQTELSNIAPSYGFGE